MGTRNASILAPSRTWSRFTELSHEAPPCISWMRSTAEEDDDLLWLATLTVREHLPER